jgi:zinc transport system ATP-binding protein
VIRTDSLVELAGAGYRFGADVALAGIDLAVAAGDRFVLVGPNGGGKSTLVRLLLGLAPPSTGTATRRPGIRLGYVPQFPTFDRQFPQRVAEMVLEGRLSDRPWGRPFAADDRRAAAEALERLELEALRRAYLPELSGGELKRALVARALVARPDLLVLDEPTASLDEPSRRKLWTLLRELPESAAVVLATHDLAPGTFVPNRAALVDRGLEPLPLDRLHENPMLCGHAHG